MTVQRMREKFRPTHWGKFNIAGWGAIALAALIIHFGPAAETALFPVTSKFKVVEFEAMETGTTVRFEFTKRRQCTLESLTWYRRIGEFRIAYTPMKLNGEPMIDQWTGRIRSARFFLPMTEDEIRKSSFATTRHRCHGLWDTTTVVYP